MVRIGVICPSEIAYRRFMPALAQANGIEFIGIGVCSESERFNEQDNVSCDVKNKVLNEEKAKAQNFVDTYGGKIFDSYNSVISSDEIDAVYIPLPPGLHYQWAYAAMKNGKHVLVEKPATVNRKDTDSLIEIAKDKKLALHENYMFVFHNQIKEINKIVENGEIGDVRLYSLYFGFPMREQNDFRYNKNLGGGALLDAGGYTLKLANILLGNTAFVKCAKSNYINEYDVDFYGSGTMENELGQTAQFSFGMDNDYRCRLDIWGSKGSITTERILTAPDGFVPTATIIKGAEKKTVELSADNTFLKSIEYFVECIENDSQRETSYREIARQAEILEQFIKNTDNL